MTRRVVEKLCTKKVCVDFLAPTESVSKKGASIPRTVWSVGDRNPDPLVQEFGVVFQVAMARSSLGGHFG